jgi:pimeloyl-ACP methyl ester carboxylesterase/class 3 adenylate cyclase
MAPVEHSETRYAQSGELSIAYRTVGEGPPDILFIPGFISNVDLMPDIPWMAHDLARLATGGRVVYFDKRGVGLSDRGLGTGTAEDRMDDLRAVADAAGIERATVVGVSEGGPLALLFAAAYPERVQSLVLWGTMARALIADDYPDGIERSLADKLLRIVERDWGSGTALRYFIDLPDDDATRRATARYERQSASPRGAVEVLRHNVEIDVRGVLDAVRVPTLVVHRSHDPLVYPSFGRYIADHVANAQRVELPGEWHVSGWVGRDDDILDVIVEFITGTPVAKETAGDRVLATVLFSDIVDSTVHAATLGDRQWRAVLEQHEAVTRREVERHRGLVVNRSGDGLLATFDGPGRAVHAALAIRDAVAPLHVKVHSGVHTGEIERLGDDVAGLAVHIGARLSSLAGADEVLVSNTVKDLTVGSGFDFANRGQHQLKGVPGEWQVWSVTT